MDDYKTDFNILCYDETDSTNEEAKRLAFNGAPSGTVVTAKRQSSGKGRLGRTWNSGEGGLYFSIIFKPEKEETKSNPSGFWALGAGIAVAKAVNEFAGLNARLKWPNDVLADNQKICGILVEQSVMADESFFVIIGIGINVNIYSFPPDLENKATSLFLETGIEFDTDFVLGKVLNHISSVYKYLRTDTERFLDEYKRLCLNIGNDVIIKDACGDVRARAVDIDKNGGLVIQREDGTLTSVTSGEVSLYYPREFR